MTEHSARAVELCLLGPLAIRCAGRSLPRPPTLKSQSLLGYLALHRERPQPRARLADLFWGERPEPRARRSLNTALWHIRRLLGDCLLGDTLTVQWDPLVPLWLDTAEFEAQLARGGLSGLQAAVALYRGELLEGLYDDWIVDERYRLEARYADALAGLMAAQEHEGTHQAALATALRLERHDPLREEAYRGAMRALCRLGQRNAALEQYLRCQQVIREELGAEPAAETTALHQAILDGRLAVAPAAHAVPVDLPPAAPAARDPLEATPAPLVGRTRELAALAECWRRAQEGAPNVVWVSGEAGVGKTRLVERLAASVRAQGAAILWGRSYEFERTLPYQPFAEALQALLPTLAPEELAALPAPARQSLAYLAPALVASPPDAAAPEAGQEQARLFEGAASLLAHLAARQPLLLVLEDLHWAGESTLALVHYLARHLAPRPVLLVGTLRPEALSRQHPLAALRRTLAQEGLAEALELGRLSREAVAELVAAMAGEAAAQPLAGRLYEETEGNPFFLLETVRALFAAGDLRLENGRWGGDLAAIAAGELPLPGAVAGAIVARADALGGEAREALGVAAVLGREFDLDLLAAVCGRGEEAALEALDGLLRAQLVQEGSGAAGRDYAFTHHKIQEVVYARLARRRRQRLHAGTAAAMAALYAPGAADLAGELAFHLEQACQLDVSLREGAIACLLQAGDRARDLYAHEDAVGYYRRALALLRQAGDPQASARVLMKLGLTFHTAFRFDEAREAYREGFSLWQRAAAESAAPLPCAPHALRVGCREPYGLDPALVSDYVSSRVIQELLAGLVAASPELDVVPDAAERWQVLEGGQRYVFHLRQDARWSDGAPLTAADFEYAWRRLLDPATGSPAADALYDIRGARAFHHGELHDVQALGVRALDPLTLAVELEAPAGHFLHVLTGRATYPVPRHVVEALGAAWAEPGTMVSNGPFRLEAWARGTSMRLARNPRYHGAFTGNVEAVALRFEPDLQRGVELYAAGEVDVLTFTQTYLPELHRIREQHAGEYLATPWLGTIYLALNADRPPFDDPRVRRALALAVDRGTLADVVLRGLYAPASGGVLPAGMPGHAEGIALPYGPNEAQELLAAAGYPGGSGLPVLQALSVPPIDPLVTEYLRAQWRDVLGVQVAWQTLDWPPFRRRRAQARFHMYISGAFASCPDPVGLLQVGDEAIQFHTHWRSPVYDRLLERARKSLHQGERLALYGQAERVLIEGAAIVPLVYARRHMLVKPWVRRYPTSAIRAGYWKDTVLASH